jgi:hypothetical protein
MERLARTEKYSLEKFRNLHRSCICSICQEVKRDNRIIPTCFHGFCFECLSSWFESNYTCPICRARLPPTGFHVENLPQDFTKNLMVPQLLKWEEDLEIWEGELKNKKETIKSSVSRKCGYCEEGLEKSSTQYCMDCDQPLCADHALSHSKSGFGKNHQYLRLEESNLVFQQRIIITPSFLKKRCEPRNNISAFRYPQSVAVCPKTFNIFVADSQNDRIQIFDSSNLFLRSLKILAPHFVAFKPGGDLLVSSNYRSVEIFSIQQELQKVDQAYESHKLQNLINELHINRCATLCHSQTQKLERLCSNKKGEVLVVDTGKKKIVIFNAKGDLMHILNHPELEDPCGIAVGSGNEIIVSDVSTQKICVFSEKFQLLRKLGANKNPHWFLRDSTFIEYSFHTPMDLFVGIENEIIVADYFNNRVVLFDYKTGKFLRNLVDVNSPASVSFNPQTSQLLVTDLHSCSLHVIDISSFTQ